MEFLLKHKLILATIAIQIVALPLILFAVKQQQDTRTKATAGTTLSLTPAISTINIGQEFPLDVMLNPGSNLVSLAKIEINYDPTKIVPSSTNPVVVNSQTFPQIIEGPIYTSGKIILTVSIGSNQSKAIQNQTKVLTLNFKANAITDNSSISFGPNNKVYSIGTQDSSNENVLATTTPASVKINATPTNTPAPTSTPVPTNTPIPSPTNTPIPSPTPIITPVVTPIITPVITPAPGKTVINIKQLKLHGIGTGGDSPNPNSNGTQNPLHPTRNLTVEIYNTSDVLVTTFQGNINYSSTTGDFSGLIQAPDTLSSGTYLIRIKTAQYLRKKLPGFINLVEGQTNTPNVAPLIAGDVNGDNALNILDYDIIIGCYSDLLPAKNCDTTKKDASDISDDGKVNQNDYNLFLRELSVQNGN